MASPTLLGVKPPATTTGKLPFILWMLCVPESQSNVFPVPPGTAPEPESISTESNAAFDLSVNNQRCICSAEPARITLILPSRSRTGLEPTRSLARRPYACTAVSFAASTISQTSSTSCSTKTPTFSTSSGNAFTIGPAVSTYILRGLFAWNTNPTASAPASTATSASSRFVIPQILTQVIRMWLTAAGRVSFYWARNTEYWILPSTPAERCRETAPASEIPLPETPDTPPLVTA